MGFFEPAKRTIDPATSGWGVAEAGRLWFNTEDLLWKFWDSGNVCTIQSSTVGGSGSYLLDETFEDMSWSLWDGTVGSPTFSTSVYHGGTVSAEFVGTEYALSSLAATNPVYIDGYVNYPALPYYTNHYIPFYYLLRPDGATIARVGMIYWGPGTIGMQVHRLYPNEAWGQYVFSASVDTWYHVKLKYYQNASTGEYRLWLDGTERISLTGLNTSDGTVGTLRLGYPGSSTCIVYIDDVKIDGSDI